MSVFVDTSAIYALMSARDRDHERARDILESLVDAVSFEVMRRYDIDTAFAFDNDYVAEGFRLAALPDGA